MEHPSPRQLAFAGLIAAFLVAIYALNRLATRLFFPPPVMRVVAIRPTPVPSTPRNPIWVQEDSSIADIVATSANLPADAPLGTLVLFIRGRGWMRSSPPLSPDMQAYEVASDNAARLDALVDGPPLQFQMCYGHAPAIGYLRQSSGTMELQEIYATGCSSPPTGTTPEESAAAARLWALEQYFESALASSVSRPVWTLEPGKSPPPTQ